MYPYSLISGVLWIGFIIYWIEKARGTKKTIERRNPTTRIISSLSLYLGAILIYSHWIPADALYVQLLPQNDLTGVLGDLICAGGIAFAVWARIILAGNWSGNVTFKQDHELIQRGPYAIVRNPMYTGVITGFLGSAIIEGVLGGFIGVVLMTIGLLIKVHTEENLLTGHFSEEYIAYTKRVKRLIPFIY